MTFSLQIHDCVRKDCGLWVCVNSLTVLPMCHMCCYRTEALPCLLFFVVGFLNNIFYFVFFHLFVSFISLRKKNTVQRFAVTVNTVMKVTVNIFIM